MLERIAVRLQHPRVNRTAGTPIAAALERAERFTEFFRKLTREASPALQAAYGAGFSQCQVFARNLGELMAQGVETMRPRHLEQICAQAPPEDIEIPCRLPTKVQKPVSRIRVPSWTGAQA